MNSEITELTLKFIELIPEHPQEVMKATDIIRKAYYGRVER